MKYIFIIGFLSIQINVFGQFWSDEDVLFHNFKKDEIFLSESEFNELFEFSRVFIDSFSIEDLKKFQLRTLPSALELSILNFSFLDINISDNIINKRDSLNLLDMYALGKKKYIHFTGVNSYYIVIAERDGSDENFANIYCLNFSDGELKSILLMATEVTSSENITQKCTITQERSEYLDIKFDFSFTFDHNHEDTIYEDSVSIEINKNGYISYIKD